MDTVFTIGIFLSFFLQFLLLSKPDKSLSDKILAVWMFIIGVHLFSYYINLLGYWELYPYLSGIHHPLPLLHGPMLYLYVHFSIKPNQEFRWQDYLHFLPALGFYIYMIPFFSYSAEQQAMVNAGLIDDYSGFIVFSLAAFLISGIGYTIFSYRLLNQYQELTDQNFAYRKSIDLNWLKYFIWGIGIVFIMAISVSIAVEWIGFDFGFNADLIFYSMLILFIFFLGFSGIRHKNIFSVDASEKSRIVEPKNTGEYKRSGLKEDDALEYHQKLTELMKTQKPYLEPKLTLGELADSLDISANHLSQIINQYEEKNFYDYINGYRVEEFKEKALKPENRNYNILSIAYDSGFNSKSSFNQVFKKSVGKTPSQYLASVKSES